VQYPHVLVGSLVTAAFFIMSVSGYHLLRHRTKSYPANKLEQYRRAFQIGAIVAVVSGGLVILTGHDQAQHMVQTQPMKMAAAEGLWETENPASFSLFTIGNQENLEDVFSIRIPTLLSILAYNRPTGAVQGIRDLQAEYQATYGPGNYVPNLPVVYWMFRIMVGTGFLMMGVGLWALYLYAKGKLEGSLKFLKWVPLMVIVPYIANTAGWIMAEAGRQPWIVFGLMKTADAVSPNVTLASVWFSLIAFTLLYGVLMGADIYLLFRFGTGSGDATGIVAAAPPEDELSVVYSGD
jgi:cytochrome d ubiquinol oxidase subunit I